MAIGSDKKKFEKKELREKFIEVRNSVSQEDLSKKSYEIAMKLQDLDEYAKSNTVMLYYSIENEVETKDLVESCTRTKTVLLTRVKEKGIVAVKYDGLLQKGKFGTVEPKGDEFIGKIDLIVIPMVAFDEERNRLGRGFGYYDRFLKSQKGLKVGIALEAQKAGNIPEEKHDIRMDAIITEEAIYR